MNDYETLKAALADAPEVRPPAKIQMAPRILRALAVAGLLAVVMAWNGSADRRERSGARRVTVVVHDGTVGDILASVARQIGATLAADSALVNQPILADFKDASLAGVLDKLCEAYSCRWSLSGGVLRVAAGGGR